MQNVQAFFSEEKMFRVKPQNRCVYAGGGILHRNNFTSLRDKNHSLFQQALTQWCPLSFWLCFPDTWGCSILQSELS